MKLKDLITQLYAVEDLLNEDCKVILRINNKEYELYQVFARQIDIEGYELILT